MSDSPSIVDMYRQMEDERVALVAWLREQHAAARLPQLDVFASAFARGLELAYQRVLERLGEKP